MVMTVLLDDAAQGAPDDSRLHVTELAYADDTLVVSSTAGKAENHMQRISAAGKNYGLVFNWAKLGLTSKMPGQDTQA